VRASVEHNTIGVVAKLNTGHIHGYIYITYVFTTLEITAC